MSIDIISLSNVEDVPLVILSDIGLDGELDIAFLHFSCLGLVLKSVFECISPRWSKPARSDVMRSSYNVFRLFLAFELGCCSLGLMLDIIAFLPCLTREDCSFIRLLLHRHLDSSHFLVSFRSPKDSLTLTRCSTS